MKEFSKEIIEIGGQEYTLFLNRQGIVAWEKYTAKEKSKMENLSKYEDINYKNLEINEDTNPFEGLESLDEDYDNVSSTFKKLYWIMLYTEHKFTPSQAAELYNKAKKEYGEEQLIQLANQMIDEANKDIIGAKQLKNLAALKPEK